MNLPAIAPKRKPPALRLVSKKELSREHWLAVRKSGNGDVRF